MLVRVLIGLIGIPLGFYLLKYKDQVVMFFGKMEWAERYLGSGGTYNVWVIIGMLLTAGSFLFMFGLLPGQ